MRSLITSSIGLLLLLPGCSDSEQKTASKTRPSAKTNSRKPAPKRTRFVPVDFQSLANAPLKRPDRNDLSSLPTGRQQLGGVEFRIGPRLLQVGSRGYPQYPRQIEGVPVGRAFRALHVLQSSQGGAYPRKGHSKHEEDGVNVGRYIVHYRDGATASFPIDYGVHLRGWWNWDKSKPTPEARIVWRGKNAAADRYGLRMRLYLASWKNPHPDKIVDSIDVVSANAKAAPFCVAMTLEDATGIDNSTSGVNNESIATNTNPPPENPPPSNPSPVNPPPSNPSTQEPPPSNPAARPPRRSSAPGGLIPANSNPNAKSTASNSSNTNKPPRRTRSGKRVTKNEEPKFLGPPPREWDVRPDPAQPFVKFPAGLPYETLGRLDQQRILCAAGPSPYLAAGTGGGVDITGYDLFDLRTGKKVGAARGLNTEYARGAKGPVHQAMSPDGKYLAIYDPTADAILVGDMLKQKAVVRFPYGENDCVLLFPRKDQVLVVHRRHRLPARLWELPSGKLLNQFSTGDRKSDAFQQFVCSPGGRYLAAAVGSGLPENVVFFDLETGKPAGKLKAPGGSDRVEASFKSFAFSPDGKEFAALLWGVQDRPLSLTHAMAVWDVETGRLTDLRVQHGGLATGVMTTLAAEPLQWFPDGRGWLVNQMYVFDRDGAAFVDFIRVHTGMGRVRRGVKIIDDRRLIVSTPDGETKVVRVKRTVSEMEGE